jgi:nucleotide-binding universal stress UspA family protein
MIGKILVPINDNQACRRSADYAIRLAVVFGAAVTFLSVSDVSNYINTRDIGLQEPHVSQPCHRNVEYSMQEARRCDIPCESLIVRGIPSDVISAMSEHYDLTVVGSTAKRGLSRIVLGSVADRVIGDARGEVLIININLESTWKVPPERVGSVMLCGNDDGGYNEIFGSAAESIEVNGRSEIRTFIEKSKNLDIILVTVGRNSVPDIITARKISRMSFCPVLVKKC